MNEYGSYHLPPLVINDCEEELSLTGARQTLHMLHLPLLTAVVTAEQLMPTGKLVHVDLFCLFANHAHVASATPTISHTEAPSSAGGMDSFLQRNAGTPVPGNFCTCRLMARCYYQEPKK